MTSRRNEVISEYPAVPGAVERVSTGQERMSWRYPENYSGLGFSGFSEEAPISPPPTPVPPYPDTLLNRFTNWFWKSSMLVKLSLVGTAIAGLVHLEKKWR